MARAEPLENAKVGHAPWRGIHGAKWHGKHLMVRWTDSGASEGQEFICVPSSAQKLNGLMCGDEMNIRAAGALFEVN